MCGAVQSASQQNEGLRVFVLRRFVEEGDSDWHKGLDVVVAHNEEEARDLAEAAHPGNKKFGPYKSVKIIDIDKPHFAYGRAFDAQFIHW